MSDEPRRGEVWRVQFNPTRGDEIQKTRPAIVVSVDGLTRLQLRLVVPLTGWKSSFTNFPWLVQIEPSSENGLLKVSAANPLQTRSVSLDRFVERLGSLDEAMVNEVVLALGIVVRYPLRSQG